MSGLFIQQADGLEVVTPRQSVRRGSQVAIRHPDGPAVVRAMSERGVLADLRTPDLLRFGFTPLYLSYTEVWEAARVLREVLATSSC